VKRGVLQAPLGLAAVGSTGQNDLMSIRWDETWHRLSEWTSGQAASERLAAQVLIADGFARLDPSHPLGGRDGKKDAIAWRADTKWIMSVYFPRGPRPFKEIQAKFEDDALGVAANDAYGMAFVTNQELRLTERKGLQESVDHAVEIYHLERITAILDTPAMQSVRSQFLGIDPDDSPMTSVPIVVHNTPDWTTPTKLHGREVELATLAAFFNLEMIDERETSVCVISGMPGVGKTALASYASAQDATVAHFSGGIIALDFNGYSPSRDRPVQSQQVLSSILLALGCPDVEPDVNKMYIRYHELLMRRHKSKQPVLLLFDNVAEVGQVGPLIPAPGIHRTLITSRNSLAARLPGATDLELGILHVDDAIALLSGQSETVGSANTPKSAAHADFLAGQRELADICGGLPIALQLVAEILKTEANLVPHELARELDAERTRLAGFEFEDAAVRGVFHGSYVRLAEEVARCFRYMAIHPGGDISAGSAASMLSISELDARRHIRRLESAHLIARNPTAQTWQMHDLLRLYGQELLESTDGAGAASAALQELGEYYFGKLEPANEWLNASSVSGRREAFEGRAAALAWLSDEIFSAVACAKHAWSSGSYDQAWRLAISVSTYLSIVRDHAGSMSMAEVALASARELGDLEKEGGALNNLGLALLNRGRPSEAKAQFMLARKKHRRAGDLSGEARALVSLSEALRNEGSVPAAIGPLRRAVRLYMESNDQRGAGFALTNLGIALREDGQYDDAIQFLSLALKVHEESGARLAEASTLAQLGTALSQAGRHSAGLQFLLRSFDCYEEVGDRAGSALAAINTGNVYRKVGDAKQAESYYLLAMRICEDFEDESSLALVLWNLLTFYSQSGRAKEAREVSNRLRMIAHKLPNTIKQQLNDRASGTMK
jgi:tetratricopeptide (TPR) repeat protein